MPRSPIAQLSLIENSARTSFACTASISDQYEEFDNEMKISTRFNPGHALLHQIQRPIILQARKTLGRRQHMFSGHSEHKLLCKKRKRFGSVVLPTKFLLGGNRADPLNLRSLQDEQINKKLNAFSPAASPIPLPTCRNQVQLLIPPNINDPLNLNTGEDIEFSLLASKPRKRRRHRKSRREDEIIDETNQILPCDIATHSQYLLITIVNNASELKDTSTEHESSDHLLLYDKFVNLVPHEGSPKKRVKNSLFCSISKEVEEKSLGETIVEKQKCSKSRVWTKMDLELIFKYRKNAQKFHYGNHVTNSAKWNGGIDYGEDYRLKFFNETQFQGKDVLDIGCNIGQLALYIAMHWMPNMLIGIDIDKKLIDRAQQKVRLYLNRNFSTDTNFPDSMVSLYGPLSKLVTSTSKHRNIFPNNITFLEANYVPVSEDYLEMQKPEYDTILCLRVTKWIHLNFGDEGLKLAFKRMFAQLRNGGQLILEPQPWFTYSASKKITPAIYDTYKSLQLRPNFFCNYLLRDVGFSSCELLGRVFNSTKVYRQDIYILTKGYPSSLQHSLLTNTLSPIPFHCDMWTHIPNDEFPSCDESKCMYSDM